MNNYLLRDVPEKLWIAVRHFAIDKKMTIKAVILEALKKYIGC